MKKILAALSLCSASIFGAIAEPETLKIVPFSIEAPRFYNKTDSVLARSEPIKVYADIKAGKTVSPEAAAHAFRELRSMRAIRKELGEKNPNAKLLDRRGGWLFGVGASPDYSEAELGDIQSELLKAAQLDSIDDELQALRTKVIEKNKNFDDEANQNLSKLVFIEKFLKDPKKSGEIIKIAKEIGMEKEVVVIEEPAPVEPKKDIPGEEPQPPAKYNFNSPDFYKNDSGGVLYDSAPVAAYRDFMSGNQKAINPTLFKEFRALREIKKALSGEPSGNPGEYTSYTLTIINNKLTEANKQKDAPDTFAPLRTNIVEKIKSDTSKLNQLVELESLWGTDDENSNNREEILKLAQDIGIAEDIKQRIPEPLASEETKPAEPVIISEPKRTPEAGEVEQKPLMSYIDDITGLLLGETIPTQLEADRKDLYNLVAKIMATKPKNAELKNISETALKIIKAIDESPAEPFDWSTEIEPKKEAPRPKLLNENEIPWIIIPKSRAKKPQDLLSREDFDEKTQKAIAGFFKSVKDFVSRSDSRIWADYRKITIYPCPD